MSLIKPRSAPAQESNCPDGGPCPVTRIGPLATRVPAERENRT